MGRVKDLLIEEEESRFNEMPHEIKPDDLSAAIRFHRKKSGLSQTDLAKLAGVGKTAIFDLEKDKQTVQLNTLLKVLGALNISMIFQSPIMNQFLNRKSK
jgi:HTH-type transcriptional regulator/antitoxin HipB